MDKVREKQKLKGWLYVACINSASCVALMGALNINSAIPSKPWFLFVMVLFASVNAWLAMYGALRFLRENKTVG
ncbi:hypothetical protein F164LOC_18360 [Pectobacterium carotovorum]|nr:hypothetical protein F164LOC_18360 [Pectobacterium carotovorum]